MHYLKIFEQDKRLNVWHIALLFTLLMSAISQGRKHNVRVNRSMLMAKSHIGTVPTYHKYFKELQEMGYICYRPSYHPGVRSEIDLIKQPSD